MSNQLISFPVKLCVAHISCVHALAACMDALPSNIAALTGAMLPLTLASH